MLMVMTVTGARFVSPRIRLYLGLAITFAVAPAIPAVPQDIELLSFRGFMTIAEQIIIGVAMGMITFGLIMLYGNMAFISPATIKAVLRRFKLAS